MEPYAGVGNATYHVGAARKQVTTDRNLKMSMEQLKCQMCLLVLRQIPIQTSATAMLQFALSGWGTGRCQWKFYDAIDIDLTNPTQHSEACHANSCHQFQNGRCRAKPNLESTVVRLGELIRRIPGLSLASCRGEPHATSATATTLRPEKNDLTRGPRVGVDSVNRIRWNPTGSIRWVIMMLNQSIMTR